MPEDRENRIGLLSVFACSVCSLRGIQAPRLSSQWMLRASFLTRIMSGHTRGRFSLHASIGFWFSLGLSLIPNGKKTKGCKEARGQSWNTCKNDTNEQDVYHFLQHWQSKWSLWSLWAHPRGSVFLIAAACSPGCCCCCCMYNCAFPEPFTVFKKQNEV